MSDIAGMTGFRTSGEGDSELFRRVSDAWEKGRAADMLPQLERALKRSTDYRLWHIHGLILRSMEDRERAIPSLRRAVELKPDALRPAHALAKTLYEAGLDSLDAYGRVLSLAPNDPTYLGEVTMAFVGAGEVHTAIAGLERILTRSPTWTHGQMLLAQLRWMEGDRDTFTRGFDEARRSYPQAIDLWTEQIVALTHAQQWDKIIALIAEGRAILGNLPVFAFNEAILAAERGETEAADRLFEDLPDQTDSSFEVRRIRHYLRTGRPERASQLIEPWLQKPEAFMFWPYASLAWRQVDPERWAWLEGDPSFVGIYDLADRLPPLDRLAEALRGLHKLSNQPLEQSLRGGTQTDGDIFMRIDPILVEVREVIRKVVAEHVAQLPPPDPDHPLLSARRDKISFAGAWSVRLQSSGFHANHVHPLGWFSSALYISLPPGMGENEAGYLTLGDANSGNFMLDLPPFRTIEPKPGRLALFPSYMWHGTRPFGEGERLTVAFDVARH